MISRPSLTLAETDPIFSAARSLAQIENIAVTICLVDDGGHMLRLERMDDAPLISLRVAEGKARTALELRMSTSLLESAAAAMPSMNAIAEFYPFKGGIPLFHQGCCIGAIGVSGAIPEKDELIASHVAELLAESGPASCPGSR